MPRASLNAAPVFTQPSTGNIVAVQRLTPCSLLCTVVLVMGAGATTPLPFTGQTPTTALDQYLASNHGQLVARNAAAASVLALHDLDIPSPLPLPENLGDIINEIDSTSNEFRFLADNSARVHADVVADPSTERDRDPITHPTTPAPEPSPAASPETSAAPVSADMQALVGAINAATNRICDLLTKLLD